MQKPDWLHDELDTFALADDDLAYCVPGDTPGHSTSLDAAHELFHEQTKYHRASAFGLFQNIAAHLKQPALIERCVLGRHASSPQAVPLPPAAQLDTSLGQALMQRKSHPRASTALPMTAQTLSTLLHNAVRTNRAAQVEQVPALTQHFSPYPSAGALYPCELYLALAGIDDIPAGIYRYHAISHSLSPCQPSDTDGVDFRSVEAGYGDSAPPPACAIIISSVFQRSVRKYGTRGYRLALLEAGHMLQNLSLVAAALDLSSLVSASFYEAELEALIGVDGVSEAVLACFLCGAAAEK